jgi:hypothetical protein
VISRRQRARKRGHAEIAENKGRMSKEGLNPFRKSTRTERSPSRSEEENLTKKIEKEMINHPQRDERGSEREEGRAKKRGHADIVGSNERKQQGRKRRR